MFPLAPMLCDMSPRTLCYSRLWDLGFMNNLPLLILSGLDLFWDAFEVPTRWGLHADHFQTEETNSSNKTSWKGGRTWTRSNEENLISSENWCSVLRFLFLMKTYSSIISKVTSFPEVLMKALTVQKLPQHCLEWYEPLTSTPRIFWRLCCCFFFCPTASLVLSSTNADKCEVVYGGKP